MDILIKNMFMPTDDVLRIEIYPDGQVRRIVGWAISEKRDSTATELPPHGTLKDADFIISCLADIKNEYPKTYEIIKGILDRTPTVLEAST